MKKFTKANIEALANEIKLFLEKNDMGDGVSIYFNDRVMRSKLKWTEDDLLYYVWETTEGIDPHHYFEYAAYDHILSMSFEGGLYDVLNYSGGHREEEFMAIFEKHRLYYELGNSWNLSVFPIDDDMEIEYTKYEKPEPITRLYIGGYDNPTQLNAIMVMWYEMSKKTNVGGSCVLGAGFTFKWNNKKYFMPAQSPYQGSCSWEAHIGVVRKGLEALGATDIMYDWGRMD